MTSNDIKHVQIVTCPAHGDYEETSVVILGKTVGKSECPGCESDVAKQKEDLIKIQREEETSRRAGICVANFNRSIPVRFENCSFGTYKTFEANAKKAMEQCVGYTNNFDRFRKTGAGLILCGMVGTGKTHLAISVGKELSKRGNDCHYTNLSSLIRLVRSSWSDRDINEDQVLDKLYRYDLLIIDEIGIQSGTENERNIIFEVINGRYERVKPTIIISNLSESEIEDMISVRSVDRIKDGGGGTIVFNWASYRGRRAA